MENAKVDPSKIHLSGMRVLKAHFESQIEGLGNTQIANFNIGMKSDSGFNLQENYHRIVIFLKIKAVNERGEIIDASAEYQIEYHFTIENLNDFVEYQDNGENFTVSPTIGATIAGIAYSTSRGIVFDRTQGTDFNGVILPVINPSHLLDQDSFTDM